MSPAHWVIWNIQIANTDKERNCLETKHFPSCSVKCVLPVPRSSLSSSWLSRRAMLINYSVPSSQDLHCLKDISIQQPRSYCLGLPVTWLPSEDSLFSYFTEQVCSNFKTAILSHMCSCQVEPFTFLKLTAICKLPLHSHVPSVSQERSPTQNWRILKYSLLLLDLNFLDSGV